FKAITEDYRYGYAKIKTAYAALNNQSVIKIYSRATREEDLKALNFKTIQEKGKIENNPYTIGEIQLEDLKKAKATLEKAAVFIAAFPERAQNFDAKQSLKATATV